MLPTVTRTDLGDPQAAGEYKFGEMLIRVDDQHLKIWQSQPDASFSTIRCTRLGETGIHLTLGGPAQS